MAKQRKRFFSLWNDITLLMQLHAHQTILNLWHHNSIKMLQQENMVCPYKKHTSSGVSLYSQGRMHLEPLSEELEQLPNQAEQRENIAQNNVINTWTTWITLWTTRTIPEQSPHDNSNNSLCNSDNWQYYVNNWTSSLHSKIIFSKSLHNTQNNSTQRLVTFWKLLVVTFAIVPVFFTWTASSSNLVRLFGASLNTPHFHICNETLLTHIPYSLETMLSAYTSNCNHSSFSVKMYVKYSTILTFHVMYRIIAVFCFSFLIQAAPQSRSWLWPIWVHQ